ncbi:organic hydroperoxide resistance protein [Dyella telluris]|uniref:Organic hydroperoxide resistance protein n=1 Tax=Dyella telluris TaxID=2763498 RepID=A0A7G8Q3R0_9GAMM|nr:organic hydroperoxide resistance protein [Dyella telluris]QNK01418.1 organic hydroperoxide resistance protein [Dyella telluris]
MSAIDKTLYRGRTYTTGGRDGVARSSDGKLDIRLSPPGSLEPGTNPEQLFAAGWSACFIGAMRHAAQGLGIHVPEDVGVIAEVDLCQGSDGYFLKARLTVSLQGLERALAQSLIDAAHRTCPYSKATRGNIEVTIALA